MSTTVWGRIVHRIWAKRPGGESSRGRIVQGARRPGGEPSGVVQFPPPPSTVMDRVTDRVRDRARDRDMGRVRDRVKGLEV